MRIGIDLAAATNQRAGIGRYSRGILTALAAIDHHDTFVGVGPRRNANGFEGELPRFTRGRNVRLPLSERYLWWLWYKARIPLPPDLIGGGMDVFYNPDFLLPRLAFSRGVCTVHDLGFMTVPGCSFPALREHLIRAVPWSVDRAKVVMAVSQSTKEDLVRLLDVPPAKIRVAPNAVDRIFKPVGDMDWLATQRQRLQLPERFVLAVGTLEPRKNLVRLLEALAILRATGDDLPLIVAGREGWLFEPIYERVDSLGLRDRVTFLRQANDRDLLALYNSATIVAFPSLYEGFGLPPLEALACGAVVVCSNASSLPEVMGDAALLVDPNDADVLAEALRTAINDEKVRSQLVSRGPAQASRYSWEASARTVLDALEEAAQ